MKNIEFVLILALFSSSTIKSDAEKPSPVDALREDIVHTRVYAVQKYLQRHTLSEQTKKELHELAHQRLCLQKAKLTNLSHNVGLKRKLLGLILTGYSVSQLIHFNGIGCINFFIGTNIYNWGSRAENRKTYECKARKIEKFEKARAIEQLICNAPIKEDNSAPESEKGK